jgi:hypothetical protein
VKFWSSEKQPWLFGVRILDLKPGKIQIFKVEKLVLKSGKFLVFVAAI